MANQDGIAVNVEVGTKRPSLDAAAEGTSNLLFECPVKATQPVSQLGGERSGAIDRMTTVGAD